MAKQYTGILGPVVGRMGSVVGYLWRGRPVFRAYVEHIHYPNTVRQQAERDWFVSMVRFASTARSALLVGMQQASLRECMTEGNYFVLRNKQHFHTVTEASAEETRRIEVDYERLSLSEGPVARVVPTGASVDADGTLHVGWQRHTGQRRERACDQVYCYIYDVAERRGMLAAPAERHDGGLALRLPDLWQHHELHCYLFAVDDYGNVSTTSHTTPVMTASSDGTEGEDIATIIKNISPGNEKFVSLQRETQSDISALRVAGNSFVTRPEYAIVPRGD